MDEKKIPVNLEAEQSVLGGVFLDNSVMEMINDRLNKDDFFDYKNQIIFQAFQSLFENGRAIDFTTVSDVIRTNKLMEEQGGKDYLLKLIEATPSAANIDAYIDIVKSASVKRKVIEMGKEIAQKGNEDNLDSNSYIDYSENLLQEIIRERKTTSFSTIKEVSETVLEKTNFRRDHLGEVIGLETGFSKLDENTLGFQPEQLIVLAARPGGGKSTFALNLAYNIATKNFRNGHRARVAVFSLEMSAEMIATKLLANQVKINSNNIKSGELSEAQISKLEEAIHRIEDLGIYFSDASTVSVGDIRSMCRRMKNNGGIDFVVIDYLQLIYTDEKASRGKNRSDIVAEISRGLKMLARELKCPILALSQLSREAEKGETKRITMAHLRESGAIEQDADIIIFLSKTNPESKENITLQIAKNREGNSDVDIQLLFQPEISRFTEIDENE